MISNRSGMRVLTQLALTSVITLALPTAGEALPLPKTEKTVTEIPNAEQRSGGLWYIDALNIGSATSQGLRGRGVKIAVIDSGINLRAAELQGANITVHESTCLNQDTGEPFPADSTDAQISGHGTSVVAMLVGNGRAIDGGLGTVGIVPEAEIEFFATGPLVTPEQESRGWLPRCVTGKDEEGEYTGDSWKDSADAAMKSGASIVSASIGGSSLAFKDALLQAAARNIIVVGAVPNPGDDSIGAGTYPGAGNGSVAVNGVGRDGVILGKGTDLGGLQQWGADNVAVTAPAAWILAVGDDWNPVRRDGTSLATPLVAGSLALAQEKYPRATSNQLLQSLVRTTDGGTHPGIPPWNNKSGFGALSVSAMLAADPLTFPDENPLFVSSPSDPRCTASDRTEPPDSMDQCQWASAPTKQDVQKARAALNTAPRSELPGKARDNANQRVSEWVAGGLALALVVVAGVTSMLLLLRRRHRR
ncbi:hypothetical protein D9V34_08660 [Mycetocola lacteus]|uniref:Peptidase S8/S53 domain-containing protein n=1 Tax=Mycetocola lacteus TaxID=76637 RepID=A0A3L7AS73_9MICO|nr:S8 family serine peptidase [Mycetocola lacteus]RLP83286.1 hypothetical protein D9V34_08660 [Mycetocola lacteus]